MALCKIDKDKSVDINVKIAEIKKRILLAEGQKTANLAEWQKQNRINNETISTLKKEIKDLTTKCGRLRNPLQRPIVTKEPNPEGSKARNIPPCIAVGKVNYPIGSKSADDAIRLTDLKITENRKQLDLLKHRFKTKQQHFAKLLEQYRDLLANKDAQSQNLGEKPPETLEEDANRKLVCRLENEIHRTNVQWMEAEHIRKKYRSIQASLMNDAERFERSLRELETALGDQQAEIQRLQQVHSEAIEMRDAAKIVLQRQEQQASISQKTRERQALDFRKQVEGRKMELERIGRKLFLEGKTLERHDSITSSSGDPHTAKTENEDDENSQLESATQDMEDLFKKLMVATGATSPLEVLERFHAQKESSMRLTYLRSAAEAEKSALEALRENLTKELEASKFSDVKESEVNQEVIERIKNEIAGLEAERTKNLEEADKTMVVLKYMKERICEMIYRFQEVDEANIELKEKNLVISVQDLPEYLAQKAEGQDLIEILKHKLERGQDIIKQQEMSIANMPKLELEEEEEDEEEALYLQYQPPKSPSVPEGEKPQPMPMCYFNLLAGRAQRAAGTLSSSPEQAPAGGKSGAAEEENEVPSRNFLKRQSVLIVDAKSRRKPFRPAAGGRRK